MGLYLIVWIIRIKFYGYIGNKVYIFSIFIILDWLNNEGNCVCFEDNIVDIGVCI